MSDAASTQPSAIHPLSWEEKFACVFEHFPDGIVITDREGRITDVNHNMLLSLGFDKPEILGRSVFDLMAPDDRERLRREFFTGEHDVHLDEALMQGRWGNQMLLELTVTGRGDFRVIYAREATHRKRMEQRIQQLSRVINDAADAISILDRSGNFILVNPAFEEMTGYRAEAVLGHHYRLLQMQRGAAVFGDEIERVFDSRQVVRKTATITRPNGEPWTADIVASPVFDNQGEAAFCVVVFRNITRQVQLQQALEESERRYRAFVENAMEGIFVEDFRGNILFTNPSACQMLGYTAEELQRLNVRDLVPPEMTANIDEFYARLRERRKLFYHARNRRKDGLMIDVEISANVISIEGEEMILVIVRDITQRMEFERRLKEYSEDLERRVQQRTEQLEKLREIGELLHSSIELDKLLRLILIAVTAGEGFRFNRAFLLLVDFEEDRLAGSLAVGPSDQTEAARIWSDVRRIPRRTGLAETLTSYLESTQHLDEKVNQIVQQLSTDLDDEDSILVQALNSGESYLVSHGQAPIEFDRRIIDILGCDTFAVVPIFYRDEAVGVLLCDNAITGHDISEIDLNNLTIFAGAAGLAITNARFIRELQQSQQAYEQLFRELNESHFQIAEMQKEAALGRMAATVAHELKTPLVGIGGLARLLLNRISDTDPNYELLKIITDESLRLEYVVERILYFARPKEPVLKSNDMARCIQRSLEIFKTRLDEEKIEVVCKIPDNLPPVMMDEFQVRQVLINIITNALDAMAQGGRLTIDVYTIEDLLCCQVRDTGCGIRKDALDRVFDPFYTSKAKGTGLGLHVSRRIIEKHGGRIELDSEEGRGTTVSIYLPLQPSAKS
ncbi:MAG: hypothetical protein Kow0059_17780 [Candidatus Sumerlaeia bacterium]